MNKTAGLRFNVKGIFYFFIMMTFMAIVLQNRNFNVQAKSLLRAKKTLKLLQSSQSLIKLRHRRDTFPEEQQQPENEGNDYYDDNYDVLPDLSADSQPPTLGDHISEQAKRIAESFQKMWQSVTDTIHHCVDALRAMFGEPLGDEELTPEQEQEIYENLEAKYRLQHQHDNDI